VVAAGGTRSRGGSALRTSGAAVLPVAGAAVLLALAAAAAAFATPGLRRRAEPSPLGSGEVPDRLEVLDPPDPVVPELGAGAAGWVGPAARVLLAVLLLVLVVSVVLRLGRGRGRLRLRPLRAAEGAATHDVRAEAQLIAALDAGLLDLADDDRDPRRAVIACWVRLEQVAAAAGVPRRPADTPADLVLRLLYRTDTPLSGPVLERFAATYRLARYAARAVDERMRTQAQSALRQLRQELHHARSGAGAP
jgi:hypothetical protein